MRANDANGARKVYYRMGSVDSLCAAAVAFLAMGRTATYMAVGQREVEVSLQGGTELGCEATLIGVCLDPSEMSALARRCRSLVCIDGSSYARVSRGRKASEGWMLLSEASSANALLAWTHFMDGRSGRDPPPVALQELSRIVSGQRLTNMGWALMTKLQVEAWSVADVAGLLRASAHELAPMMVSQQAVVESKKTACAALSGSAWPTRLGGMRVRAIRTPVDVMGPVAQRIAELHSGVVGMAYHEDGSGTVRARLAGRGDVSVEGLASAYGGRGTGSTAEFEFPEALLGELARGELRSLDVHREREIASVMRSAPGPRGEAEELAAEVVARTGGARACSDDWWRGKEMARTFGTSPEKGLTHTS